MPLNHAADAVVAPPTSASAMTTIETTAVAETERAMVDSKAIKQGSKAIKL